MTTILLIDDEKPIIDIVSMMLTRSGYDVIATQEPYDGIQKAHEHQPDLIICDIMMPDMSGHEVLQALRSDSNTATIPFIFLTALSGMQNIREALDLGADDFITKEHLKDKLLISIQTRLHRQHHYRVERLRQLTHNLVKLQEDERWGISQSLSEDILPTLVELRQSLRTDTLHSEMLNGVIRQVETLAMHLYPTLIDHLSLTSALMWLFEQYDLQIDFQHKGLQVNVPVEVRHAVFRTVQEVLDMVIEGGHSDKLLVEVANDDTHLFVQISDDHLVFNLAEDSDSVEALRLMTIMERIAIVQGHTSIQSTEEAGTQIDIEIQLVEAPAALDPKVTTHDLMRILDKSTQNNPVTANQDSIRVAIAHQNHPMLRGLLPMLKNNSNLYLVGEINELAKLPAFLHQNQPQVLVINPYGNHDASQVIQQLANEFPHISLLILSHHTESRYVISAIQHGALGYLPQDTNLNDLLTGIVQVSRGRYYISPSISQTKILDSINTHEAGDKNLVRTLTSREREVFKMIAEGKTNNEVARNLSISVRTVETHRHNLMRKLGLHNQHELLRLAMRMNMISMQE